MRRRRSRLTTSITGVAALAFTLAVGGCGSGAVRTRQPASTSHHRPATHRSGGLVRNATPRPDWRPFTGPVPILVYHDLGTPPAGEPYPGLYVPDGEFEQQIAWLARHRYQAVTLDEVMNAWYRHGTLPDHPIVITFDNGYIPQATFAPSVLSRYGWPGVLNEITADHLNNTRIRSLLRIGWEIDSHSVTHPDLTTLTPSELRYQLTASRQFLQRTFHIPVNSFCYPSSKYNATVIAAVKAAGYTNALTENPGYATKTEPYLLNRFEIEDGQGTAGLAADLQHR
ncbi:MAG TPA: polysaccharide deacetylase family protein [Solirubrobacteraceae bacterium]|nr:polysaccharide deacetylase family protein [Solirubrobacteraceae bacterium]